MPQHIEPIPRPHANQSPTLDISGVNPTPPPRADPTNPCMVPNPAHANVFGELMAPAGPQSQAAGPRAGR
jgi:hypothetical protein